MANEPDWIDDKWSGTGGFGATADTSSITAPPPTPPQGWGDLAKDTGKLFVGSTEGAIGAGERFAAPYMSDPDAWRQSGTSWVDAGQKMSSSLSAAGQQTTDAPFFSMETLQHPINKAVMGIGKQGPWLAPALIPGGGVAGMALRGAAGAALGYTGAYSGVVDTINAQPDDQLQKNSPTYMEIRKTYPEYEAKQMLVDQAWDNISPAEKVAIMGTSALAGEAGPMTTVGKTIAGSTGRTLAARYAEGRLAKAGINAVETGAVTGGQYAGTAIPTREALTSVGAPADTPEQIARGTIEATGTGAVVGGFTRFVRPHGGKNESRSDTRGDEAQGRGGAQVVEVPAGQADPGQAASLQSAAQPVTGYETPYPHPIPTGYEKQYPPEPPRSMPQLYTPPPPTGYEQQHPANIPIPPRPTEPPTGYEGQYTPPEQVQNIKPPFTVPPTGTQRPLGINVPDQPERPGARGPQGELPLRPPQAEPVQGELDLQQPGRGVTQRGLPGMGADVVHEAAPPTTISPDQPLAPIKSAMGYGPDFRMRMRSKIDTGEQAEPEAKTEPTPTPAAEPAAKPAKAAKAPSTKDSEEAAAPAAKAAKPKTGPEIVAAAKPAAKATAKTTEAKLPPETAKWLGKEEPTKAAAPTTGTFDESKLGTGEAVLKGKARIDALKAGTEAPAAKAKAKAEAEAPAQMPFMITQLMKAQLRALGYKSEAISNMTPADAHTILQGKTPPKPTQVERPTVEAKGEVPVTKVASTDARLGGTKISDTAREKAAAGVAAVERKKQEAADKLAAEIAAEAAATKATKKKGAAKLKDLKDLGKAVAEKAEKVEKEAETEPISDESKLDKEFPSKKEQAIEAAGRVEDAKASVEPNPTEAQEAAGNYKQGHPPASATQGQPVTIHSAAGDHGEAEGHILGTANNIPAEHLDTLIHPANSGLFHVVNELDANTSRFVRHVVVQGAETHNQALGIFAKAYERKYGGYGDKLIAGGIVDMSREQFERWKQTRNPNEPAYPTDTGKHPFNTIDTRAGKMRTLGSNTLKGALGETLHKLPNTPLNMLYRRLANQVIKYLPDVPVYYLKQADLEKVIPNSYAVYSAARNYILMGDEAPHPHLTLLHEALHAATTHLYSINKVFKMRVDRLTQEYKQGMPGIGDIMSDNVRSGGGYEMLAELGVTKVQKQLAQIQMSHSLAKDLNMERYTEGTPTLWNGFVSAFKDALRSINIHLLGADDKSKYTLLDGLLRLNDEAFANRSKSEHTAFANMLRGAKDLDDSLHAQRKEQYNSQENVYNTIHDAVSNPDKLQDHYFSDAKSMSDRASDLVDKLPRGILKEAAYKYIVPFQGRDSLRMDKEGLFGKKVETNPYRRYNEDGLRRDNDFGNRSKVTNDNISDMFDEYRGHTRAQIEHLSDTFSHATAYRVDPRYKIGEGTNEWMTKPGWQWRNEAKQAIANHDRITRMYNDVAPGLKSRFTKMINDYRKAGREQAEMGAGELIDSISNAGQKFLTELKTIDPKDAKLRDRQEYIKFHNDWETNWEKNKEILRDHLLNNNLTENEERWLAERGFKDISDIRDLATPRGPFVPLDHAGEFILDGRMKIAAPANGKLVDGTDNVFRFKSEAEAEAFLNKQPPRSNMSSVYFNDKGEQVPKWDTWQNEDGSVGFAKDNKAWHVQVNDKYYSGHDSISAANRRYDQLKASGAFAKLSPPQSKRSGWYSGLQISSPLFKHLISEVEKRTDYSPAQKKAVIQLLTDSALSSMEGNRIAKHLLPRKAVAGWDTDYIKTYKNYFDPHNALMSRAKYAKGINEAINEMMKYAEDHQFDDRAAVTDRSLLLTELNKQDSFFGTPNHLGSEGNGGLAGRVMKYAEAASFFANMVSPGHLITHQTHQILTYDMLAAKYGPAKAMARASKMHGILAGTGFRNVLRSVGAIKDILTKNSKGLNYVEGLMDKVSQDPKYGAELRAMLNEAIATNRIHPDQGFDASVLNMGSGRLDRGLARLDLASRQMMGSTEAYSRVWGYSLAYTLARDAGESIEQARRTAFDTVSRTQGMLSRSNMSSVMNKWYMRAPMQFRAWGINMMVTLAKSIHDVFKPDAPGVRAEAVRRLLYLFGSTMALTGINGLPSDAMRVGLALTGALGLTNYSWSDAQDKMRKFFADETSPGMANFLMDGALASLGPFSFFGADRVGFGSLAVFGEPDDYTKGSIVKWIMQIAGGAPFEEVWKVREGVDAINEGRYDKAIEAFVPLKVIDDWARAWQGAYYGFPTKTGAPGMEPYSAGETFMASMGLTPARKERWREASEAEYRAEKATRDEKTQLLNELGKAGPTGPDSMKAKMQISAFNLRNPQARISPQDVARAMRRQTAPAGLGRTLTKSNTERVRSLEEYYEAY